jgi:hypothetical protein
MGYSLSWAALKNGTLDAICAACDLRPTDKREEIAESAVVAAKLLTGWYLVLYNRHEIENQKLAKLSSGGEVVSCFVEDHVMFSSASGWNRGRQVWKVFHDCKKGTYHVETIGAVPAVLVEVRKRLTAEQDAAGGEKAVDYIYDIPAELAKALTGFRHDQDVPGMTGDAYQILESVDAVGGKQRGLTRLTSMFKGKKKWQIDSRSY